MHLTARLTVQNRVLEYFVVCVVVISITVVAFISLRAILAETRDSQRVGDMAGLRSALELYHIDHGVYPQTGWVNSANESWNTFGDMLKPYTTALPRDPLNDAVGRVERTGAFNYSYYSAEKTNHTDEKDDYVLVFRLEKPKSAPLYQKADIGLVTARGMVSFRELTGADGIYAITAP